MEKIDILSLDLDELTEILTSIGEKKFRAKQIFQWLHVKRVLDFDKMTDISVQLRRSLNEIFCINGLFSWNTAMVTASACRLRWAVKWGATSVLQL